MTGSGSSTTSASCDTPGGVVVDTVRTQNVGYEDEQVTDALSRLAEQGHGLEVLEGSSLSEEQQVKLRSDVWGAFMAPHQKKGRKIGNSFGTNSDPWQDFGTDIPVLLVYEDGQCVDVYPHHEGDGLVTITDYVALFDA